MRVEPAVARLFSWLGAVLFAVSLVYFLFTYITRFATVTTGGNVPAAVTWNVMLFTLFAMHHSVFARERVRGWIARIVPPELERACYVWIASVLFLLVCAWWRPVPGVAWELRGAGVWVLRALQILGVWLTLRSASILGVRTLAGVSPAAPDAPVEFKTTGPYGWVRHPIYSGWFLLVFAVSLMTMTRLVFAVVSCAYLVIAIPFEERSMRAAAPGAYDRYMAQVRWKLLPRVY